MGGSGSVEENPDTSAVENSDDAKASRDNPSRTASDLNGGTTALASSSPATPSPTEPSDTSDIRREPPEVQQDSETPAATAQDSPNTPRRKDPESEITWTPNISAPEFKPGGGFDVISMGYFDGLQQQQQQQQGENPGQYGSNMAYLDYGVAGYSGSEQFLAQEYAADSQWLLSTSYHGPVGVTPTSEGWYPPAFTALATEPIQPLSDGSASQPRGTANTGTTEEQDKARRTLLKLCGAWQALQGSEEPIDRETLLMYQGSVPRRRKPSQLRTLRAARIPS